MKHTRITTKLIIIAFVGGVSFIASLFVLGLVSERESRSREVQSEISGSWGKPQVITGPLIVGERVEGEKAHSVRVLPETVHYETLLKPEVRTRGLFSSVVYTSTIRVNGEFSLDEIQKAIPARSPQMFSVVVTDTSGIEKQVTLRLGKETYDLLPGPGVTVPESSGFHANVHLDPLVQTIPFAFEFTLKGSERIAFSPLGKETTITISSPWQTPKFYGSFLPSERTISSSGFRSEWRITSFGRSYPQSWEDEAVSWSQVIMSSPGVELQRGIDLYDLVMRSIKYAILFIAITFAAFFLFDVLAGVRIHAIQYLLIGASLALFYLLLLSLAEQIGFLQAYLVAAGMIILLIWSYSTSALKSVRKSLPVGLLLVTLYSYLYFVLQLEDYALLFGAFLLFVVLALVMFLTRKIDWFALDEDDAQKHV